MRRERWSASSARAIWSARDIAKLTAEHHFKRVPVVKDGKLVGIVARADLVRALADSFKPK